MRSKQSQTVPWWFTDLGDDEIRAIADAIRERHIQCGPVCSELERTLAEVLGVPHVVTTASGSAALALSLLACDVGPGDEVIVPAATYIATAHACLLTGARVRLVDVLPDRPLIDPAAVEAAVTPKTRAIIAVHLNGAACDMAAINAIAAKHGLAVVEDAAQALGSRDAAGALGTQGDAGAFSMSIAKLIATGEGGFVATRDADRHARLLELRNQGVRSIAKNVFDGFGFNFRLTDMLAAMGLAQAAKLPAKIAAVKGLFGRYAEALADLPYLRMVDIRMADGEVPLWAIVLCSEREKMIDLLEQRGIQTRPVNPSLAASPHLENTGHFPNAERFCAAGLRIPSGPDQSPENLDRTIDALRDIAGEMEDTRHA
jgi:perosamine synthetase